MARVGDDGQVAQVMQHRHGVEVERVARARLIRADAALAQNDVGVALAHDVLGAHEQLVNGASQAALEKHGLAGAADLLEQVEVLGVARADLPQVDVVLEEERHLAHVHDLGHDGHPELRARLAEQVQARLAHALVGIGARTRLERASSQDRGASCLHCAGDLKEVLPLNRARTRHDLELTGTDGHTGGNHDLRVHGVELAVGGLERLGHTRDRLDDPHGLEQRHVDARGVADEADDGGLRALGDVDFESFALEPAHQILKLVFSGLRFDDSNHVKTLPVPREQQSKDTCGRAWGRSVQRVHPAPQNTATAFSKIK